MPADLNQHQLYGRGGAREADALGRWPHARRVLASVTGGRFSGGNHVSRLLDGGEIFDAMLRAIGGARRSVDLLTFAYWEGEVAWRFADSLAERAAGGVRVRVLVDAYGARRMPDAMRAQLLDAGVAFATYRTVWRHPLSFRRRTHRKLLICDGQVAFTGGVGIAAEWAPDGSDDTPGWRDTHFEIRGPVVDTMRGAFVSSWLADARSWHLDDEHLPPEPEHAGDADCMVVQSASNHGWSRMAALFRASLSLARESIRVSTAYLVPDEHILRLLCDASERGVDVSIVTAGEQTDEPLTRIASRSLAGPMLDAGVGVHRYAPSMYHAKAMIIDDLFAVVGSPNLNHRSQRWDEELALVVHAPALLATLGEDFEADRSASVALTNDEWRARPLRCRLAEWAVRPLHEHL